MDNMKNIINKHNAHILSKKTTNNENACNCRNKDNCPLQGICLISNPVYKAEVSTTDNTETKLYIGMTSNQFKRFNNQTKSFRDQKYSNETELSNYIWDLKRKGREPVINWSILKRARAYENGGKPCNLCIEEKLCVMKAVKTRLLNKRSEIFTRCRHQNKFRISNLKQPISKPTTSSLDPATMT